jgi:hypothetical protein
MDIGMFRFTSIFFKLLWTRLLVAQHQIVDKLINIQSWALCTLVVFGYVMQATGLATAFGIFQLGGTIATAGLFESYGNIATLIMDFAGEQSIGYYLTLPLTPSVVLLSSATAYACIGTILSFSMIILGKILFYAHFNLWTIAWGKLLLITILANLFYGLFAHAIAAQVGVIAKIGNVWSRFIFPLWFLGGYQFSWAMMYKTSVPLAYVILLNPLTYIMEGTRATLEGPQNYLSWWLCMAVLTVFTIITWFVAFNRMKKRLDFV